MVEEFKKLSLKELEDELDKAYRGANNTADDPWQDGMNAFWNERIRTITAEKKRRQ